MENDVLGGFPINKTAKVSFQEKNFSPGIENDRTEIGVEVPLTAGFGDSATNNDRLFQDSEEKCDELALSLIHCLFDQFWLITRCTKKVHCVDNIESDDDDKDTINCPEKVMKISHFNQTKQRLLSIL